MPGVHASSTADAAELPTPNFLIPPETVSRGVCYQNTALMSTPAREQQMNPSSGNEIHCVDAVRQVAQVEHIRHGLKRLVLHVDCERRHASFLT